MRSRAIFVVVGAVLNAIVLPVLLSLVAKRFEQWSQDHWWLILLATMATAAIFLIFVGRFGRNPEAAAHDEAIPRPSGSRLDQAAYRLAGAVREQWQEEPGKRTIVSEHHLLTVWLASTERPGTSRRLDATRQVVDTYLDSPSRKLVILGAPGSGKTAMAVLLTRGLIDRWHERDGDSAPPVPVFMSVADWNPREMGLIPWMAARLAEVYPFLRNRERYGADAPGDLLRAGRVLPVLDGLDEIGVPGADEPAPAVVQARAIDEIVRAELPALVLTSRGKEYELAMARALHPIQATEVKLEAIRISDAERYIERESTPAQWAKWAPVLAHVRQNPQSPLAQALSKALMVVLAREVYAPHGMDPDKLTDQELFRDVAAIESRLLSGLVEHAFPTLPRRQQAGEWEGAKAKRWLTFLAARRGPERRQPDIAWWRLPDLAGRAERILAGVAGALFCGPAVGLGFGLVFNAWAGRTAGLVGGLAFGAAGAAVMGVIASRTRPTPSELQLGGSSKITAMARACAGIGVIAGLAGWVVAGAGFGAAAGAILGVPLGFAYGGVTKDATVREATPRRLLRQDIRVAVVFGSAYGFTTAWLGSLAGGPVFGLVFGVACAVAGGLLYGLPWVLALQGNAGVIAWVHLILARLILVPRGDLPWKVLDFLEAAHARGVLRRVGPVYQFRHESLRDALAETAGQTLTPQAPAPAPAPAPDG